MNGTTTRRAVLSSLLAMTVASRRVNLLAAQSAGGRVLVVGATGKVGQVVARILFDRGLAVTALARDEARARAELPAGVDIATGDLRQSASLTAALSNVSTIAFAASASSGRANGNTPEAVDYGGVAALLNTLGTRRLRQFVLISSMAVTQPQHPHNLMSDLLLWKLRGENLLRGSGQPYSILRPGGMRGYPGGVRSIQLAQDDRFGFGYVIARDDAAKVCAATVGSDATLFRTFEAYNDDSPAAELQSQFEALHAD